MEKIAEYKTGSSLVLEKPNDIDVVWFYATKEDKYEALKKFTPSDFDYDVHFDYVRPFKAFIGCYIYLYMELISGEDLHLDKLSIFDHKEEYVELLKRYANYLPRESKLWYHVYLGVSILDRGKSYLTKEQKQNAQLLHDNGINDKLYDYIIDYLNKV